MRPIKFRAWDLITARIIHVAFIEYDAAGDICNIAFHDATVRRKRSVKDRFHQRPDGEDLILQQFTGLTDKNGKEIYEGDVVRYGTMMHEIVFRDGGFQFAHVSRDSIALGLKSDRIEVIGNIYENPELLPAQPRD